MATSHPDYGSCEHLVTCTQRPYRGTPLIRTPPALHRVVFSSVKPSPDCRALVGLSCPPHETDLERTFYLCWRLFFQKLILSPDLTGKIWAIDGHAHSTLENSPTISKNTLDQRCCRANMARKRQPRPVSGLGFQGKVLKPFQVGPFSLGSGWRPSAS